MSFEIAKLRPFIICARCVHAVNDIQPRERAHTIHAVGITQGPVIGRFQIRGRLDRFRDVLAVEAGIDVVGDDVAPAVDEAQTAVVMFPGALGADLDADLAADLVASHVRVS